MINNDKPEKALATTARSLAFVIGIIGGAMIAMFGPILSDPEVRAEMLKRMKGSWSRAAKP